MPLPLAHPAAVLPLRRYCPATLSFSALMIGSVVPDLGYLSGSLNLEEFSHRLSGSFGFGLPAGLAIFWVFTHVRARAAPILPVRFQRAIVASISPKHVPFYTVALSILVGAWTHILWDSFTHKEGWAVLHVAVLRLPIGSMFGHTIRVFHLLWYISSFAGVAVLWMSYEAWKPRQSLWQTFSFNARALSKAVLLGVLALVLGAAHHLLHSWIIFLVASLATGLVLLAVEWRNWASMRLNSN